MLLSIVAIVVAGVNIGFLAAVYFKLKRISRYFYTPDRRGPGAKFPPIPRGEIPVKHHPRKGRR